MSFLLVVSISLTTLVADAAKKTVKKTSSQPTKTSLVVDGKSGKILHSSNAQTKIYPASLTKVMTIYHIFEALESGKLNKNQ